MFFKKKKEVEEVKEESLIEHYRHKPVHFKKPELARDDIIKSIFQRDFSMLMPKDSKGQVVAMDGAVCKCKFNGNIIPNDILEFYGSHNFIGFEACAILRQNPYIDKACTIPAQDSIASDYKISYAENNKDEKKVDEKKLEEMKRISDKEYNIKEVCYHANVNKKTFGISLVVPVVDGVDYKKPYSIDKVKKGSYKGMVVVEPYWVSPQLDSGAVANPMNVGFQEPTWWRMPDGTVVHKSWCIKRCNSELPDILKPTYYYGGVPLTQKIYERVYAAEKVANEAPQLALTKRMLIADANIANLMANPEECQSILNLVQWCRDNFSVWFKNPDDQVSQIDTSLTDFDALVMTQYQLVASIADMPATKLLKTQPKGFNATGEYEQKDYIQSLQAIQEQDYIPILKMHYELFTKSFYGELIDLSIVFNPIDTPTEKETAEVAKIWSDIDSNYIASGVVSADEIRDIRRSEEGSAYSTLADDIEGEAMPEVDKAVDEALEGRWITENEALDEKWITVKRDHNDEEEKGRHLLLEDGETPAEAMKRQWGVELKKKEEKKDEPKEENPKGEEKTSEPKKENPKEEEADINKMSEEELGEKWRGYQWQITALQNNETQKIKNSEEYKKLAEARDKAEDEYYSLDWNLDSDKKQKASEVLAKAQDELTKYVHKETDKAFESLKYKIADLKEKQDKYFKIWQEKKEERLHKEAQELLKKDEEARKQKVERAKKYYEPESIGGASKSKPMSREEADGGNVNPHYNDEQSRSDGYRTNCQSCVVAYEARLRGYNVEVLPNKKGSVLEKLSHHSKDAWIDLNTGEVAEVDNLSSSSAKKMYNELDSKIEKGKRYVFRMVWKRDVCGHVVSMGKDDKGMYLYDPQSGKTFREDELIHSYLDRVSTRGYNRKPWLLRIDDKAFNPDYYNQIMKKIA